MCEMLRRLIDANDSCVDEPAQQLANPLVSCSTVECTTVKVWQAQFVSMTISKLASNLQACHHCLLARQRACVSTDFFSTAMDGDKSMAHYSKHGQLLTKVLRW